MLKTEITTTHTTNENWSLALHMDSTFTVLIIALTNYDWAIRCVIIKHIAHSSCRQKSPQDSLALNVFYLTAASSIRIPISIKAHFTRSRNGSEFSFVRVCSFLYRISQAYHVQLVSVALCEQRSAVSV